jgi:hypothetical protein
MRNAEYRTRHTEYGIRNMGGVLDAIDRLNRRKESRRVRSQVGNTGNEERSEVRGEK